MGSNRMVREVAKIPFEIQRHQIARTLRQVVVATTVCHNYHPSHAVRSPSAKNASGPDIAPGIGESWNASAA